MAAIRTATTATTSTAASTAANRREGAAHSGAGKFGLTIEPLTPQLADRLELPGDVEGVVITDLDPSGAAASAGLREGDVIQQINGRSVQSAEDVRSALSSATSDKPAVLLVARGGTTIFVPLRAR